MKTKNMYRDSKVREMEGIRDLYPDLAQHEQKFVIIQDLFKQYQVSGDHQKLGSLDEYSKVFNGIYIHPKTGRPCADSVNATRRLLTVIRKDKGHPHIRPWIQPFVEVLADGTEVIRNYVTLLVGRQAVNYQNVKLETQRQGLKESQKANNDCVNTRRVKKELEQYRVELEIKQQEAIRKRKQKGGGII
jgi:hypothetical protein